VKISDTLSTSAHLHFWRSTKLVSIYALPIQLSLINPYASSDRKPKMGLCIVEIQTWITTNKLKLNGDKTELIILSLPFSGQNINFEYTTGGNYCYQPSFVCTQSVSCF